MTSTEFSRSITIEQLEHDPYPIYERLRAESPVVEVPCTGVWMVTTWKDAELVSTSVPLFVSEFPDSPLERSFGAPFIMTSDGDVHRQLRGGIEPSYRPRKAKEIIEQIARPLIDSYLDALPIGEPVDLMAAYFEPTSAMCIARSIGFDDVDADTLVRWFQGLAMGGTNYENDPIKQAECDSTCAQIDAVMIPKLERLSRDADGSVLSNLLHAGRDEGDPRPVHHALPSIKVTMLGGMQEPGHGSANTLAGLLLNPDQMTLVRENSGEWLKAAIMEGLRWMSPVGTQIRTATQDTNIGDVAVPKGTPLASVLASANRDESRYSNAGVFDIKRKFSLNAAFGFGPHLCAGRFLAPLLMHELLGGLLARFSHIDLVTDFTPQFCGWEFRTASELMVTLRP